MDENTGHIITLEELQELNPKINKKIVLVNSSKYTEDAYEHLLDLIDEAESIAFVINERKIYTHGEYFGGDLWEETLNYFSKYVVLNDNNEITSQVYAQTSKDAIQFKGEGGITVYSDYDSNREASTIHVHYDLNAAVDSDSIVNVNDELALTLGVENNKVTLKEYRPVIVEIETPQLLEFDSGTREVTLNMTIDGSEKLKTLNITATNGTAVMYDWLTRQIKFTVQNNKNVSIYVDYNDVTGKEYSRQVDQKWGYAYVYGYVKITEETFDIQANSRGLEDSFKEKTISFSIPEGRYGWVAYPSSTDLVFIDDENGMIGGWRKDSKFTRYSTGIEYQVYRTEQTGLGKTKWRLQEKH